MNKGKNHYSRSPALTKQTPLNEFFRLLYNVDLRQRRKDNDESGQAKQNEYWPQRENIGTTIPKSQQKQGNGKNED